MMSVSGSWTRGVAAGTRQLNSATNVASGATRVTAGSGSTALWPIESRMLDEQATQTTTT